MNKFLYFCASIVRIQTQLSFAFNEPKLEHAPVAVLMLKEENPELQQFFDTIIADTLKIYYAQNGYQKMAR